MNGTDMKSHSQDDLNNLIVLRMVQQILQSVSGNADMQIVPLRQAKKKKNI